MSRIHHRSHANTNYNHVKISAAGNTNNNSATYTRNDTPSSFRVIPQAGASSLGSELSVSGERIAHRIAETREWLHKMNKEVRLARRKQKEEQESASLLCCVLRASSALLTEKSTTQEYQQYHQNFRLALNSFLDGTPFLTPQALCRYNVAIAELLSDEQLELMRRYVFNYDETAFADLLYADDVLPAPAPYGVEKENEKRENNKRREIEEMKEKEKESVRRFNERSRHAMRRLIAAPGGLGDATMRAALIVPIVPDDTENNGVGVYEE